MTDLDREMAYTDWRTSCRSPHPQHEEVVCRRAPHDGDHAAGFGSGRMHWPSAELTACPDCGAPAEVVDRYTLESTSGPVVHIATACAADRSHHYVQTLN